MRQNELPVAEVQLYTISFVYLRFRDSDDEELDKGIHHSNVIAFIVGQEIFLFSGLFDGSLDKNGDQINFIQSIFPVLVF